MGPSGQVGFASARDGFDCADAGTARITSCAMILSSCASIAPTRVSSVVSIAPTRMSSLVSILWNLWLTSCFSMTLFSVPSIAPIRSPTPFTVLATLLTESLIARSRPDHSAPPSSESSALLMTCNLGLGQG